MSTITNVPNEIDTDQVKSVSIDPFLSPIFVFFQTKTWS